MNSKLSYCLQKLPHHLTGYAFYGIYECCLTMRIEQNVIEKVFVIAMQPLDQYLWEGTSRWFHFQWPKDRNLQEIWKHPDWMKFKSLLFLSNKWLDQIFKFENYLNVFWWKKLTKTCMKNTLKKFSLINFSLNRQKVRWELCIYYLIYTFSDLCFQIKIDFKVTNRPMVQVIWVFQKWFLILIETLQQKCLQYSINLSFNSDNQLFQKNEAFPAVISNRNLFFLTFSYFLWFYCIFTEVENTSRSKLLTGSNMELQLQATIGINWPMSFHVFLGCFSVYAEVDKNKNDLGTPLPILNHLVF